VVTPSPSKSALKDPAMIASCFHPHAQKLSPARQAREGHRIHLKNRKISSKIGSGTPISQSKI
jgi:hypothetical protein